MHRTETAIVAPASPSPDCPTRTPFAEALGVTSVADYRAVRAELRRRLAETVVAVRAAKVTARTSPDPDFRSGGQARREAHRVIARALHAALACLRGRPLARVFPDPASTPKPNRPALGAHGASVGRDPRPPRAPRRPKMTRSVSYHWTSYALGRELDRLRIVGEPYPPAMRDAALAAFRRWWGFV